MKQFDLFGGASVPKPEAKYPDAPGWRDPVTSRLAAEEIREDASTLRGLVLVELRRGGPCTVHRMAAKLDRAVPAIQPRFSELLQTGQIRWSGRLEINAASNKRAKVWEAS